MQISVRVRGCTLIKSTHVTGRFLVPICQVPLLPVYHCPPECPWLFERAFLYTGSLAIKLLATVSFLDRCKIINPVIYFQGMQWVHATRQCCQGKEDKSQLQHWNYEICVEHLGISNVVHQHAIVIVAISRQRAVDPNILHLKS